eukprot:c2009_g1_i2.p1 GENE.c2009_g1_i2~~c2009_g1_i2.p1  ORF type:complete len:550 (+),score=93.48 c2009_g1_i2:98-1651(+)
MVDPVTLNCGHSFDSMCVAGWFGQSAQQINSSTSCPVCTVACDGVVPSTTIALKSLICHCFPEEFKKIETEYIEQALLSLTSGTGNSTVLSVLFKHCGQPVIEPHTLYNICAAIHEFCRSSDPSELDSTILCDLMQRAGDHSAHHRMIQNEEDMDVSYKAAKELMQAIRKIFSSRHGSGAGSRWAAEWIRSRLKQDLDDLIKHNGSEQYLHAWMIRATIAQAIGDAQRLGTEPCRVEVFSSLVDGLRYIGTQPTTPRLAHAYGITAKPITIVLKAAQSSFSLPQHIEGLQPVLADGLSCLLTESSESATTKFIHAITLSISTCEIVGGRSNTLARVVVGKLISALQLEKVAQNISVACVALDALGQICSFCANDGEENQVKWLYGLVGTLRAAGHGACNFFETGDYDGANALVRAVVEGLMRVIQSLERFALAVQATVLQAANLQFFVQLARFLLEQPNLNSSMVEIVLKFIGEVAKLCHARRISFPQDQSLAKLMDKHSKFASNQGAQFVFQSSPV